MRTFKDISHEDKVKTIRLHPAFDNRFTMGRKSSISLAILRDADALYGHSYIGNFSYLSDNVAFINGSNHIYDFLSICPLGDLWEWKMDYGTGDFKNIQHNYNMNYIFIGNDVWCGHGVTLMDGVHVGNGAICGTNALITKDVPPYAIVGGSPAKIIRYRFPKEQIDKLKKIKWWYWNLEKIKQNEKYFRTENIDEFINEYYSKCNIVYHNELAAQLSEIRAYGCKICYYEPDMNDLETKFFGIDINRRIILQYFEACLKKEGILLLIKLSVKEYDNYIGYFVDYYKKCVKKYGIDPRIVFIKRDGVALDILQNIDYIIINHKESCMINVDYASDYGAKILSGFAYYIYKNRKTKHYIHEKV